MPKNKKFLFIVEKSKSETKLMTSFVVLKIHGQTTNTSLKPRERLAIFQSGTASNIILLMKK